MVTFLAVIRKMRKKGKTPTLTNRTIPQLVNCFKYSCTVKKHMTNEAFFEAIKNVNKEN